MREMIRIPLEKHERPSSLRPEEIRSRVHELQAENLRLRQIVSELLLRNQQLRSQLHIANS